MKILTNHFLHYSSMTRTYFSP